jgi:hypothetical protein
MGATVMMNRMEIEIWLPVVGFEPLYEISSYGRIRSKDRIVPQQKSWGIHKRLMRGKILSIGLSRKGELGYAQTHFHVDGKRKLARIHRVVAEAFIGPSPFDGAIVMHLDDNRTNNHYSNLQWGSYDDNSKDMVKKDRQRKGESVTQSKLIETEILEIINILRNGGHPVDIGYQYNVCEATIRQIRDGKTWTYLTGGPLA